MKFAVFIALAGIAAATNKHQHKGFVQTKFMSFDDGEKEEAPAAEAKETPAGATPTGAELEAKADREKKAAKIAEATKEVEKDEEKDALKSNKEIEEMFKDIELPVR